MVKLLYKIITSGVLNYLKKHYKMNFVLQLSLFLVFIIKLYSRRASKEIWKISLNMRQRVSQRHHFVRNNLNKYTYIRTCIYISAMRNEINIFSSKIYITRDMHDEIKFNVKR